MSDVPAPTAPASDSSASTPEVRPTEAAPGAKSSEDWKNLAAAAQSIAICLSLLIGGAWTIYTFSSLKLQQQADAELTRSRLRAHLDLEMKIEPMQAADRPYLQRVLVQIKNNGSKTVKLIHEGKRPVKKPPIPGAKPEEPLDLPLPLAVYTVTFKDESAVKSPGEKIDAISHPTKNPILSERRKYPILSWDNVPGVYTYIEPQETYDFDFLVDVEKPGVFMAYFFALVDESQQEQYASEADVDNPYVMVRRFFTVPAAPTTRPSAVP